jgi:hypothetical protein
VDRKLVTLNGKNINVAGHGALVKSMLTSQVISTLHRSTFREVALPP